MNSEIASSAGRTFIPPFELHQEITNHPTLNTTPTAPAPVVDTNITRQNGKSPQPSSQPSIEIPGNPVLHNQSISEYLHKQLSVKRLNEIHLQIWWAGRPGNIRPLHRQVMMHRELMITEDPSLHLVWYDSTIYIKPLPVYLLRWQFFADHICTAEEELYGYAAGFLYTYACLVRNQSDFKIAKEAGLMPAEVEWVAWSSLATTLLGMPRESMNKRYQYGELRLKRLNHIAVFCRGRMTYHSIYTQYDHFFSRNFAWLVLMFAYVSVVLGAMQVVLAATADVPEAFKDVSYGFGIFTIVVVVVGVVAAAVLFLFLFVYFMIATLKENQKMGTWR